MKLVPHSGNVVIRARGHEMFDMRLHDSPAVSTWIVQTLRCHLGLEEP